MAIKPGELAPSVESLLAAVAVEELPELMGANLDDSRYLHWQELKHRPAPRGWAHPRWWLALKLRRQHSALKLPLLGHHGQRLQLTRHARIEAAVHALDLNLGGRVTLPGDLSNAHDREAYVASSLVQEAIHSSLYEGAVSTVENAKLLLRSGRAPVGKSERMISNNYAAMQHIRATQAEPLSVQQILTLHRIVTEDTLAEPELAGATQTSDQERVVIVDEMRQRIAHRPPPAAELPQRLARLVAFANAPDVDDGIFVHPIVRAILVHFHLAFDHPFADGNGRTARALFYWCLLNRGYWLAEYLSISRLLLRHRGDYENAFLKVETDPFDVSYFVLQQLDVLQQAVTELHTYIAYKQMQRSQLRQRLRAVERYNHRQQALLDHALRKPGTDYTHEAHARSHQISIVTARSDLLQLVDAGLLSQHRQSKHFVYRAVADLGQRLAH